MSTTAALSIIRRLETSGSLALRGVAALHSLRQAIGIVMRESGLTIAFDPASDPVFIDYLTMAGAQGLEGAAKGALIGVLLGALFGRPEVGLVVGASLGGLQGVARGTNQVQAGWRVRAIRDWDGTPLLTVQAE